MAAGQERRTIGIWAGVTLPALESRKLTVKKPVFVGIKRMNETARINGERMPRQDQVPGTGKTHCSAYVFLNMMNNMTKSSTIQTRTTVKTDEGQI